MSETFFQMTRHGTPLATIVVSAAVLLNLTSTMAEAQTIEGVWGVVTQERNCATNAPTPAPPTRALVTFHAGGAVHESRYIPVFATGQLSEAHGIWRHAGGTTFTARVVTMVQFDTAPNTPPGSPGFQAGWQVAAQTFTLTGPDSFAMTGSSQFYNANREVYRVGCASRVGERFK